MSFPQFAFNNVRRNGRTYIAYFLSSAFMVMIFFTYAVFIFHPKIEQTPMGKTTSIVMLVAAYIVYIFAFFFVLYSISVFLKSRNKEFGILMILGARSSQINLLIFLENMLIGVLSIFTGISGGLLLSKLFLLLSSKMASMDELPFYWPIKAILFTSASFITLFLVISVFTLFFIRKNRVLELLKGSSKPKKEPKVSFLLSLLGVILLAMGFYTLRLGQLNPLVIVVAAATGIAGTYFFYSQLLVLFLRFLKRSRKRTWRGINLLWISEMCYKLKDNARMLFLVTVVTSVACMSVGFVVAIGQTNKQKYMEDPFAFDYSIYNSEYTNSDVLLIQRTLEAEGITYKDIHINTLLRSYEDKETNKSQIMNVISRSKLNELISYMDVPPVEEISKDSALLIITEQNPEGSGKFGESITLEGTRMTLRISNTRKISEIPASLSWSGRLLVIDDRTFETMKELSVGSENDREALQKRIMYSIPAWNNQLPEEDGAESVISASIKNKLEQGKTGNYLGARGYTYWSVKQGTALYSFIGVFIALIFSISSASFLYFKLHTELAADRTTYHALSKIGLSTGEMKSSATLQIALLFFVPILVATIQTLVVLNPILNYMGIVEVNEPVLMTSAAFLVAQMVYFVIVRARYVHQLNKMMV